MNLKAAIGRGTVRGEADVNIIGVMNLFLILVPFLLLTAVFVKIAVLELSLPAAGRKSAVAAQDKPAILNILAVEEDGFQLNSPYMNHPKLPKVGGAFDYKGLTAQLKAVKAKYPESEDIVISPASTILYEVIVKVMDTCREAGFPNISLAG
ncbi:MAG: biopolymer transporter ExbD [bacterium]|jgi:biopolymer transport protein ExbD|nr:biopolymer transporter ExbD [candidate division KSB1 bacterium]MDH7559652.1 biopolymer transporter ExbD [bacterium]